MARSAGATSETYNTNNQIQTSSIPGLGSQSYDSGGNQTFDGINSIWYDAENRVCAVYNSSTGQTTQYLYDADGRRVAKGHPTQSSPALYCPTGSGDFAVDESYIVGQEGEQVSALDGYGDWVHSNVFAAGQLLVTYAQEGAIQTLHFDIADPLGTKRVQATALGAIELTCLSLPFGDGLTCSGPGQMPLSITSPAKNATRNQGTTISGLATTQVQWAASCRRIGAVFPIQFPMQTLTIHKH